ncbi:MAG TPA: biosynthetic peptidoglycan transglycosylase, partial [Gemmatimonas sp.]|uniref:biosynthetic peptidoglycan transglycosylase n=1 Tax=Gemmatimonas sp. TaxID=1962908 RepID=UPI002EDA897C
MIRFRPRSAAANASAVCALAALTCVGATPLGAQAGQGAGATQTAVSTGEPWRIITPPQATLVLARDGALLGELGRERRVSVAVRTLPKYVGQAFIAVEDKRFYQHDGVDLVGVAGALKDAVTKGNLRGASTITQLLVGNMHPDVIDRRDRSPTRKLREQQAAREMERHYSKEQIL